MIFRLNGRTPRNQVDLQADSGTVRYDLDMLVETASRYVEADVRKPIAICPLQPGQRRTQTELIPEPAPARSIWSRM